MTITLGRSRPARAGALLVAAFLIASSSPATAALDVPRSADPVPTEEVPQALRLLAPFACGTAWQGSTYHGHGSNDWNLDLNRVDLGPSAPAVGSDLGQPILAQADGVVVWFKQTGYNKRAGTYLEVDYGDVSVRYLHLIENSIPDHLAEIGAPVTSGETLGLLGATGRASGPHLHLEYWDSAGYENSAWFQLPRSNHRPIAFAGQAMIAEPGQPSPVAVSTNCPEPIADDRLREITRRHLLLHWF